MMSIPLFPIIMWLIGLLSLAGLGFGGYWVIGWLLGAAITTTLLVIGIGLLIFTFFGRYLVLLLIGGKNGTDNPEGYRVGEVVPVKGPDGTELNVEMYGPKDGQPLIFTHGLGANSTDWYYAKRYLAERYRVIVWDLAGTGKSGRSPQGDYSMEKNARDLEAVLLKVAGNKPAVIFGHSLGGMTTLTFCKLFPQHLGTQVAAVGLVNTTYTNPVKTTTAAGFVTAIQKPILQPLLYLIIALFPLVWVQSWLSYLNGMSHIPQRIFSFCGKQTRNQLDYMTILTAQISPSVLAKQTLGMFKYDATETLRRINVPVLIVAADVDRGCIPEASHFMHQAIPNSTLVTMQPSGHVSIMEQHEQFTSAVTSFVNELSQPVRTRTAS